MEQINLRECFDSISYLSHLILESDSDKLTEVVEAKDYDIKKCTISVTLNGVEIRTEALEVILKDWVKRCTAQHEKSQNVLKDRVALLQTEEGLIEKARELAKDMCYKMADKFEWDN